MSHLIDLQNKGDGNTDRLILSGEITISEARELKDVLLKAIDTVNDLHVNMEGVLETDLSLLQLLCATHRAALKQGKRVKVEGKYPAAVMRVMTEAGYSRREGCVAEARKSCLWIKQEKDKDG